MNTRNSDETFTTSAWQPYTGGDKSASMCHAPAHTESYISGGYKVDMYSYWEVQLIYEQYASYVL